MLRILEVGFTEHTQEDGQQKKSMPVLIRETASCLRNVIPWTDSLEAAYYRTAARTVAFFPPAAFNWFVTAGDGPQPKDAKCGTLPQTGALPVDT